MNKLTTFILFFLFAGFIGVNAQTATSGTPASSYPLLENKLEKSDKDLENPKKNVSAKYWFSRAELMMDAYEVNLQHLGKGFPELQVTVMFGSPNEKQSQVIDGVEHITNVYDRVTVTFANGVIESYEETKPLYDNPLPVALEALEKAEELDTDGKLAKKIKPSFERLGDLFVRQGVEVFVAEDYKSAFENFEYSVIIDQKPMMEGSVDTVVIFNTGMAASKADMIDESIKYYELAKSYDYPEPSLYVFLKNKYLVKGDTAKGIELLGEGFDKYPDSQDIVVELINYYLTNDKGDEALNYITIALEKDPQNVSLIFAEAVLYDKQGEVEKAVATYTKALEIDPEYYNGYYNLAVVHYNYAQKLYDDANDAPDDKYKQIVAQGDEELKKAIPLMKKCYELNPEEISSLETLKNIYYRLKMDADYEEVKALLAN